MINEERVGKIMTELMSDLPVDVEHALFLLSGLDDKETLLEIVRRCYRHQLISSEAATIATKRLIELRNSNQ